MLIILQHRVFIRLSLPEERLLCAQDLDCGSGVLGQVGERARMRDEPDAADVKNHEKSYPRS